MLKIAQGKQGAGVKGTQKRWHSQSDTNGTTVANEKERNVIEREEKINNTNSNTKGASFSSSSSLRKQFCFAAALRIIIPPRNTSGRMCFNNISRRLCRQAGVAYLCS